jgi:hypothetical protein
VKLTFAITAINTWNRIAIAFRPDVGAYRPEASTRRRIARVFI